MITINLLPADKKNHRIGSGPMAPIIVALVILLLGFGGLTYYLKIKTTAVKNKITDVKSDIAKTQKQTAEYDKVEKKLSSVEGLLTNIKTIDQNSSIVLQTFSELKKNVPTDVKISGIVLQKGSDKNVVITGVASSVRAAARFREQFDTLDWVSNPRMNNLSVAEDGSATFNLIFTASQLAK